MMACRMRRGRRIAGYRGQVASERDLPRSPGELPVHPAGLPRAAKPPLTQRLRAGHWVAIDGAVAALAALCDLAVIREALIFDGRGWFPAALLLAVAIATPIALRRRAPALAFGALLVLGLLLSGLTAVVPAVIFLAAAYVLYTVTAASSKRTGAAALGLVLVALLIIGGTRPNGDGGLEGVLVPVAFANIIAWMTGYSVRQRRLYVVRLQYQAASSAVAEERLRIARELHDVVAHSMSVIAVQAGYGQYVIDSNPAGARDALGAIQATSRDALEEMRRMLGVLRQPDVAPPPLATDPLNSTDPFVPEAGHWPSGAAPLTPAPGLADIDRLIRRTCGAGVRVRLDASGRVRPVPAGIDLSAYRIIQEALTNVVKHAGSDADCTVTLHYGVAALDVQVIDDGGPAFGSGGAGIRAAPRAPLAGTGHGIIGMRERVNLCGGTFRAGPLAEAGFLVAVTLPLPLAADEPAGNAPAAAAPTGNAPAADALMADALMADSLVADADVADADVAADAVVVDAVGHGGPA